MWFPLEPTDLDYTRVSPFRLHYEADVRASAERVFDVFTSDDMRAWFHDLNAMRWTSAPPHGVGSTRTVEVKPMLAVKERFLAWDRGARVSFAMEAINVPLVKRMLEDFRLVARGPASCGIDYTIHYTPTRAMLAVHPVARMVFGKMFTDVVRRISEVASRRD